MGRSRKSYKGQTFNRLTILEDGLYKEKVLCECVCGNLKRIMRNHVTTGQTKSCGCLLVEHAKRNGSVTGKLSKHGLRSNPLYSNYNAMMNRCYNPKDPGYRRYGALGVTVCERWRGDSGLQNFIEDMMPTYFEGFHLDKDKFAKPNQPKCYSPETTCWLTREENTFISNNPNLYPLNRLSVFDPFISYKLTSS